MSVLTLRLVINTNTPKLIKKLMNELSKFKPFIITGKKTNSYMMMELPAQAFNKLEPLIDITEAKALKLQLLERDDTLYQRVKDKRKLSSRDSLLLLVKSIQKTNIKPKPVTKPCSPDDLEYQRIKRVIRGLELY